MSVVDAMAAREFLVAVTAEHRDPDAVADFEASWGALIDDLCADVAARRELADLAPALAACSDRLEGAEWVALLLRVLEDEPFVALRPETGTGLIGRFGGISDTIQLHTLLMAELPPGGRVPHDVAANARGEGPQILDVHVTGAWNLYTYAALRDGELPDPESDRAHWIWNESAPGDIPVLDGHRVLLLGPPAYQRTWQAARTFAPLKATFEAEPLGEEELRDWMARCEEASAA